MLFALSMRAATNEFGLCRAESSHDPESALLVSEPSRSRQFLKSEYHGVGEAP